MRHGLAGDKTFPTWNPTDPWLEERGVRGYAGQQIWLSVKVHVPHVFPPCAEVMAIPSPEVRFIKEVPVFAITASFSLIAYLWLMFMAPSVAEVFSCLYVGCAIRVDNWI